MRISIKFKRIVNFRRRIEENSNITQSLLKKYDKFLMRIHDDREHHNIHKQIQGILKVENHNPLL